jgi:hypothetical protein
MAMGALAKTATLCGSIFCINSVNRVGFIN